jgi:hypothetical protein
MTPRDIIDRARVAADDAVTIALGAYAWTCVLVAVVRWELQEQRRRT